MIKKVIDRFLGQIGVNIEEWYQFYKRPANIGYNIYFCKNNKKSKLNFSTRKKQEKDNINNRIHEDSLKKRKQDIEDKKKFFGNSKVSLKDETKRSDILNFFQFKESKKPPPLKNFEKNSDDLEQQQKEILDLKFYEVDENENIIEVEKEDENKKIKLIKIRENQMTYLENIKKLKILKKKKSEIINICKFCTGFDNFSINDIEDVPCINIQCKIFYEKLKIENEIDEYININKSIENLEYDLPEELGK